MSSCCSSDGSDAIKTTDLLGHWISGLAEKMGCGRSVMVLWKWSTCTSSRTRLTTVREDIAGRWPNRRFSWFHSRWLVDVWKKMAEKKRGVFKRILQSSFLVEHFLFLPLPYRVLLCSDHKPWSWSTRLNFYRCMSHLLLVLLLLKSCQPWLILICGLGREGGGQGLVIFRQGHHNSLNYPDRMSLGAINR